MKHSHIALAMAAAWPLLSASVLADESTQVLGDIQVTARSGTGALLTRNVLTSVDVITADKLQHQNVLNSWELLGLMPGLQMTETRMGAESGKATFRAFNGEGYLNGIKVLIDGVPSNVNSGNQRFIDMIFPIELDYIEVVRGTNDPRHGLHNIGGNFQMVTRQGGQYQEGRITVGSFNTREVQLALGHEAGNWSQNYTLAHQASDGHREHSQQEKLSLSGKWFYSLPAQGLKAGLVLRAYQHDALEPGYLTASELNEDRAQSPAKNANDRSDREMHQAALHLDWQATDQLFWSNRLYLNAYDDDRRITFTSNPVGNGPRQRRQWQEEQLGWVSSLTWRANAQWQLEGGLNVERQDNHYRRVRFNHSVPTQFDVTPARIQNDDDYTLNNVGAYVQAVWRPDAHWKVVPALRVDRFSGSTVLRNSAQAEYPLQSYGWIEQPKLSVVYSPSAQTSVYANWGQTFQALTGSRDPAYMLPDVKAFQASINTGKELGVKFKPLDRTEARVALWRQDSPEEVANMPSIGSTVNLGSTRRQGLDLQVNARPTERLQVWASHSAQQAKVRRGTVDGVVLDGNEVISTPRHISNLGADLKATDRLTLGLQARSQGKYFIDNANRQGRFGSFALLDARAGYALSRQVSLDLQVKNVTDRAYEYVWFDNFWWPAGQHQPMFSPGPGRALFVSVNVKL